MRQSLFPSPATSLRTQIVLIVLAGVVLPLGLVGFWLTRTAQRSGEALLVSRLDLALVHAAQEAGDRWVPRRTALLRIADDTAVQRTLREPVASRRVGAHVKLGAASGGFRDLRDATQLVLVSALRGGPLWVLDADTTGAPELVPAADSLRINRAPGTDVLPMRLPIYRAGSMDTVGTVEARFRPASLVPAFGGGAASAGTVFVVLDRTTHAAVVPLPFDASLLGRDRFVWGGEPWLTVSRTLDDPPIELLAAAPSDTFTRVFEHAARTGLIALVLVALAAITVATLLTRRATRSLVQLADAADAVTRGELDRHVEPGTRDEIGRVTHAFNTMTESLRRTLAELSQRQAVAAVGEFASALAHEIRNPLSAMRLNLQHVQERLPIDAPANEPLRQVLRDIDRLDGTLGSALRIARTGKMSLEPVELRIPLEAAMRIAAPEFERRGVILEPLPVPDRATRMLGDSSALEQLFINLLLNAAQACEPGARAGVRTAVAGDSVTVTVWDTGRGFAPEAKNRAFDPFFTTKAEGTGLGLTVARRIVLAHRGEVAISSAPGGGTEVRVEFPVAATRGTTEVPRGASK